jgi:hypothetical protein
LYAVAMVSDESHNPYEFPDDEWKAFVSEHLTPEQLSWLKDQYKASPKPLSYYAEALSRGKKTARTRELERRHWCRGVVEIEVTLRPGGVAVQRHPQADYELVIRWKRDKQGVLRMTKIEINPDDFLSHFPGEGTLFQHGVAFKLRVEGLSGRKQFLRAPRRRPAAGKAPNMDFYRRVLDQYDALVNQGQKAPAVELARRMGEPHSTVKSYIRRGKGYLAQERKEK